MLRHAETDGDPWGKPIKYGKMGIV
jgi:hypothetical protein